MPHRQRPKPTIRSSDPPLAVAALAPLIIIVFTFACYWTLTKYYFAQDDFIFLERASIGLGHSLASHFSLHPGHFRPLTKGLYFVWMWRAFGLNPFPYHIISLLFHAVNSILVGTLLRRVSISRSISWIASLLFAANMAHFVAVAWISCIQQLLGTFFTLLALILALDAVTGRGRVVSIGAVVAYALALCSYEQTVGVPIVLVAWQVTREGWHGARQSLRDPLRSMLLLLVVYATYVFVLRGLPDTGTYKMSLGHNVMVNLQAYTGSILEFWMTYPIFGLLHGFTASHAIWILLVLVHIWRGMFRGLLFGLATMLVFLAPVLPLSSHTEAFHMYPSAIGAWYVLASATEGVLFLSSGTTRRLAVMTAYLVALVVAVGSMFAVDRNTKTLISPDTPIPCVFVLRRALLAENVCETVKAQWAGERRICVVYGGPSDNSTKADIKSATGGGSAIRLILRRPDLIVNFCPVSVLKEPPVPDRAIMIADHLGRLHDFRK